ncbi:MAG: CCA tRNA nucleotidyltransferase [Candidatus Peregrinibacteria bacterium]
MHHTALSICQRLQNAGYEAVFAGGSVRDMLLEHLPDDIDIATNAKPEEIEKLFHKSFGIGKHFGVILILENGHHFEVATFRSDSGDSDGRRPNAVLFTTMEEDAQRRDFTINALFWDPIAEKLFDFVEGQKDLKNKILRFVGNPEKRIQEDHLRILRAVRFKNRFLCHYEAATKKALSDFSELISHISGERIQKELEKILLHPSRGLAFQDLLEIGIIRHILPELFRLATTPDADASRTVWNHTLACLETLPETVSSEVAWAVLFHDLGKAETLHHEADRNHFPAHQEASERLVLKIAKRLKFSRQKADTIAWLVKNHIRFYTIPQMKRYHQLQFFDHPFFPLLIEVCRADALGHDGDATIAEQMAQEYQFAHGERLLPQFHPDLLNGKEIQDLLKTPPGKRVGEIKSLLREAQISGQIIDRANAEIFVKKFLE